VIPFSERSELPSAGPTPDTIEAGSRGQAFAFLFALLCDPHDEVLVPAPGRMPDALAQLWGVHLSRYPLACDRDRWSYDVAAIYDAIGERTRAIVVASPCEPVGAILDRDDLEALAALEVPIVADESSIDVPLDPGEVSRVLATPAPTLTFAIDAAGRIAIGGPDHDAHEARARLAAIASAHGARSHSAAPIDAARCRANLARLRAVLAELARAGGPS